MDKVREALERIVQLWEGDHAIPAHDLLFEARNIARVALSQSEGWIPATEDDLPRPQVTYADHSYPAYSKKQMLDFANGRSALPNKEMK